MVQKIRALCAENGTNLRQLEIALGIGNGVIARWDESTPTLANLIKVADYFGVTVDELIREEVSDAEA